MNQTDSLRQHLVGMLEESHSHVSLADAVAGWPEELRGARPPGATHSAWELLEHMRIAQWDILEFSRSATHVSPEWPAGYWPDSVAPPNDEAWDETIEWFTEDRRLMLNLLSDPSADLHKRFAHGTGQTLLREALTLATHNSYHIGQLLMLRRVLGA